MTVVSTNIDMFLILLQICSCWVNIRTIWLLPLLIILSHDIQLHHGPHYRNCFFNFMTWNLNSLVKDNFFRVNLLEAQNSIFNYDLIAVCETNLNDSIEIPDQMLPDYSFEPPNNPSNIRDGGVGLSYKSLQILLDFT